MKRVGLFFLILLISQLLFASEWEGTGTLSSSGLLPDEGYYVATNAFPRNTVVNLINMENRQSVRVIVASGLDSPGLLAMVSRDAANAIGLTDTVIGRIRMSTQSDTDKAFVYPEEIVSNNADPDFNPRAAVAQYTENTLSAPNTGRESLPGESDWIYPEEVEPQNLESLGSAATNSSENLVDIPETYIPSVVTVRDDAVVTETAPQPTWIYPQEVDGTQVLAENLGSGFAEDLSNDGLLIIPENVDEPVLSEAIDEPESAIAVTEPIITENDIPETSEPPVLLSDDFPSVAVIPSQPITSASEEAPEITDSPILIGDDNPSVAVIPSQPVSVASESANASTSEIEEIYETPESNIAITEPGIAEEDFPETSNPPILFGSDDPSVTVIASEIPPSSSKSETLSSPEETYETANSTIAVVEPGVTMEDDSPNTDPYANQPMNWDSAESEMNPPFNSPSNNPETETELAFISTGERPPEHGNYGLPSESEITSLPAANSAGTAPQTSVSSASPINGNTRTFSVESISEFEAGAYYVQLGVFSESDSVEQVISDIGPAYPLKVHSTPSSSNPRYRVVLGPVNIGEGSALLKRFKTNGYSDAFIIPQPRY